MTQPREDHGLTSEQVMREVERIHAGQDVEGVVPTEVPGLEEFLMEEEPSEQVP